MADNNDNTDKPTNPDKNLNFNFKKSNEPESENPKDTPILRTIPRFIDLPNMNISPKKKLITPWLTEKSISLISGWRGTGKTWFALSLLDAVSQGKPFGPWETGQPVPCLYLDGELPIEDIRERLNDLGADINNQNSPYIYSNDYESSRGYPKASLYSRAWCAEIKMILSSLNIKLWVIDNLASLAGGLDENTKKDWDPINSWLLDLRFAGISTIMLQNTNKTGGQRGTSAREDNIDTSIILEKPSDYKLSDGCRFIVKFTKNRAKTENLGLINNTEFNLTKNDVGISGWTYGKPKNNNNTSTQKKKKIIKLISEGIVKKDIANELNVTPTYVSRIGKTAVKDGYLNSN